MWLWLFVWMWMMWAWCFVPQPCGRVLDYREHPVACARWRA